MHFKSQGLANIYLHRGASHFREAVELIEQLAQTLNALAKPEALVHPYVRMMDCMQSNEWGPQPKQFADRMFSRQPPMFTLTQYVNSYWMVDLCICPEKVLVINLPIIINRDREVLDILNEKVIIMSSASDVRRSVELFLKVRELVKLEMIPYMESE